MVPLIKRSTDNLVAVMGEKANAEVTFDSVRCVYMCLHYTTMAFTSHTVSPYRVYSSFTLETIIATAFGRQVNIQRGESDEFIKAMDILIEGLFGGHLFEDFALLDSTFQALPYWDSLKHINQ